MRILVDTNVIIDYLMEREPYYSGSEEIFSGCQIGKINGYIAAHSISNLFYILRKNFKIDERRELLKSVCSAYGGLY